MALTKGLCKSLWKSYHASWPSTTDHETPWWCRKQKVACCTTTLNRPKENPIKIPSSIDLPFFKPGKGVLRATEASSALVQPLICYRGSVAAMSTAKNTHSVGASWKATPHQSTVTHLCTTMLVSFPPPGFDCLQALIVERLSTRHLIVQCSHISRICI